MYDLHKSALFVRQLRVFAGEYARDMNAGNMVALRFIDLVEEATHFIQHNPFACVSYVEAGQHPQLATYDYRKWRVKGFPHSIFFKVDGNVITIAGIYAQKMNIAVRFPSDMK